MSNIKEISVNGIPSVITTLNIDGIEYSIGTDTSDATATESDILLGKTAYVNGNKLIGMREDLIVLAVHGANMGAIVPSAVVWRDGKYQTVNIFRGGTITFDGVPIKAYGCVSYEYIVVGGTTISTTNGVSKYFEVDSFQENAVRNPSNVNAVFTYVILGYPS